MKHLRVLDAKDKQRLYAAFATFSEKYKKSASQPEEDVIVATFVLKVVITRVSYLNEAAQATFSDKKEAYEELLKQELAAKQVNPNSSILPAEKEKDLFLQELTADFRELLDAYLLDRQLAHELGSRAVVSRAKTSSKAFGSFSVEDQLKMVAQEMSQLCKERAKYSVEDGDNDVARAVAAASIQRVNERLAELQTLQAQLFSQQRTFNQENQIPIRSAGIGVAIKVGVFSGSAGHYGKAGKPKPLQSHVNTAPYQKAR